MDDHLTPSPSCPPSQIQVAQSERGYGTFSLPIVLLVDRDKGEMDGELADGLGPEAVGRYDTIPHPDSTTGNDWPFLTSTYLTS